jgi:hypothetical protein
MSADEEDFVVCNKDKVGELEVVRIRSNREREDLNKKVVPEELRGRIDQVETKMVKKFQKWQVSFRNFLHHCQKSITVSDKDNISSWRAANIRFAFGESGNRMCTNVALIKK